MALMTLTDRYRSDLLALVDRYKSVSGKADSSVSMEAFPTDFNFVFRLRRGENFTIYKAEKLEEHLEGRFEEIRRQLAPGSARVHSAEEVHPLCEAEGEPPSPHRPEEGGAFADEDGATDWPRRIKSFNSI